MDFMAQAVKEAYSGVEKKHGGPFGAVIVRKGKILVRAHNLVLKTNDPSAHAEITAIRKASKKLKRFDLSDCEIYATCEPCPMCLGAIEWASIKKVYYGSDRKDAEAMGFRDNHMYNTFAKKEKSPVKLIKKGCVECLPLLDLWRKKLDKKLY